MISPSRSSNYSRTFASGLIPPERLTVSEWADRHRWLPDISSEPGRWRTSRTPYLAGVMDALSAHEPAAEVVFMKGSQIGATEAGNNWLGYIIDHAPAATMMVLPTQDLSDRNSQTRIRTLIRDTEVVRDKVAPENSRSSANKLKLKEFPGGLLILTGANSASGLRSTAAKYLFLDELDAFQVELGAEGNPVLLAERATRTFPRRKVFKVSTPLVEGVSNIQKSYEDSDQAQYHVPCPHCGTFQVLSWKQVSWEEGKPETAKYACEECGVLISNHEKTGMLAAGKWIARFPDRSHKIRGFHLSALYSPVGWFSWADAAVQFVKAGKNPTRLKVFVNTVLGETWKEKGEAPEWSVLYHRRLSYEPGTVPAGGLFLTAGVDVQDDRLECEVVAWGREKRSWSVEYYVFPGRPEDREPWVELDRLLTRSYMHENGRTELSIQRLACDSAHKSNLVYDWVRQQGLNRAMAIRGMGPTYKVAVGQPKAVDVDLGGRKIARGCQMWPIGVSMLKGELYGWLRSQKPTDPKEPLPVGWCEFPQYPEEFFQQLCAEQIVVRYQRGYRSHVWEKTRNRNEALDCRVYARAAAAACGLDRMSDQDWLNLEAQVEGLPADAAAPTRKRKGNSDFWRRHR